MKSTQGFTLIELLIVIAIIGILAAVLIPNLLGARGKAIDTGAAAYARNCATAVTNVALSAAQPNTNNMTCVAASAGAMPAYMATAAVNGTSTAIDYTYKVNNVTKSGSIALDLN